MIVVYGYVVKSSGGTLYGWWSHAATADEWAKEHEEQVGDYTVEEVWMVNL